MEHDWKLKGILIIKHQRMPLGCVPVFGGGLKSSVTWLRMFLSRVLKSMPVSHGSSQKDVRREVNCRNCLANRSQQLEDGEHS